MSESTQSSEDVALDCLLNLDADCEHLWLGPDAVIDWDGDDFLIRHGSCGSDSTIAGGYSSEIVHVDGRRASQVALLRYLDPLPRGTKVNIYPIGNGSTDDATALRAVRNSRFFLTSRPESDPHLRDAQERDQ